VRPAVLACALCSGLVAGAASASGPRSGSVQGQVRVNPLSVVVVVPADPVKAGKDFRIHAQVANAGASAVQNVAVTLVVPPALVLRDPVTQTLPRMGPAEVRTVHWAACSTTVGVYVVMARAISGPFTAESAGQLVQIRPATRPSC
jgi:hypothetical protein